MIALLDNKFQNECNIYDLKKLGFTKLAHKVN